MESPPSGFTDRVMQNIQLESTAYVKRSSPLISKAGWIGIAASLTLLIVLVFFGSSGESTAEAGLLAERLPSFSIPEVNFSFGDLFSWINLDSPTLFWIFTGIGGIALLAFLERIISNVRSRNFYLL